MQTEDEKTRHLLKEITDVEAAVKMSNELDGKIEDLKEI